jgi:hypothetical protein
MWPVASQLKTGSTIGSERAGPRRENYLVHYEYRASPKDAASSLECSYPQVQWTTRKVGTKFRGKKGILLGSVSCAGIASASFANR